MDTNLKPLVLRAKQNDSTAWEELYTSTRKEAYFVALKVLGREQDAADLVQDAYIIAMERIGQLQDPEKFRSWFHMIVANRCRNYLRIQDPTLFSDLYPDDTPVPDWKDERSETRPEEKLDHKETIRLVAEMIEALPTDQRLCVILYYREELSVAQIAQSLEVSEGTVKSRLNYARKKIKKQVDDLEKQGIKLYGLTPLPFLLWGLQADAEATALPGALTAGTVGVTSGSIASAAKAAAASGKALLKGAAAKAVAVSLAATVTVSGVAVHQASKQNKPPVQEAPPMMTETKPLMQEDVPASKTDVLQETIDRAYHAYETLLASSVSENGLEMKYYTYLDLDKDLVPELVVMDDQSSYDTWTEGELYCFENGALLFAGDFGSRYMPIFLVNDSHIWAARRMTVSILNPHESIEAYPQRHTGKPMEFDNAVRFNGGEWDVVSEAECQFYAASDENGPIAGETQFVKTAEPILLQPNTTFVSPDKTYDTSCFSLTIPHHWEGKYILDIVDESGSCKALLYEKTNREAGLGGSLMSILAFSSEDEYVQIPNKELLGITKDQDTPNHIVAIYPTDVQGLADMDAYQELWNEINMVVDSVIVH